MRQSLFKSKLFQRKWLLVITIIISSIVVAVSSLAYMMRAKSSLTIINNAQELQTRFNQDKGMPRVILLMSPT